MIAKACMQVEHLTYFLFAKSGGNFKDTLVGRLAKQQRTNNIKQRNVEMQISVRLALVALTACQLTPYGPLSISNSQYVVCSMSLYSSIYIFSANTTEPMHKHLHFVLLSYIRNVGSTSYIIVLCLKTDKYNSRRAHVKKDA